MLLTVAILAMVVSGLLVDPLVSARQRYHLTSEPVRGPDGEMVLATQVFGWARGIMIDVIWIRMDILQQDQRYFELAQLAKWACALVPRVPDVWDVQAWNMAYNVSCEVDYLPDRWAWVWSGFELLRDEGIPNNPNAYDLYWSLSWILFHKIGGHDDNAHTFYKERFAVLMQEVLGGKGEKMALLLLDSAPRTREELLADKAVAYLAEECRKREDFDILEDFYKWYHQTDAVGPRIRDILEVTDEARFVPDGIHEVLDGLLLTSEPSPNTRTRIIEILEGPGDAVKRFDEAVKVLCEHLVDTIDPVELRKFEALKKIELYARSRRLREEFGMEVQRMLAIVQQFRTDAYPEPPIDWRGPFPHSMYWAQMGLDRLQAAERSRRRLEREFGLKQALSHSKQEEFIEEDETIFHYPRIRLKRLLYFSMQRMVQHGRILFDTMGGYLHEYAPEYRLADTLLPVFDELLRPQEEGGLLSERGRRGVSDAYRNFLERGIAEFYFIGDPARSNEYFRLLAKGFPAYFERVRKSRNVDELTYDAYISYATDDYESNMSHQASRNRLRSIFVRAFYYYGCKDDDKAAEYEQRALKFKRQYDEEEKERQLRGKLEDDKIRRSTLVDILAGTIYRFPEPVRLGLWERLEDWYERNPDELATIKRAVENLKGSGIIKKPEPIPVDDRREDLW
jgi:hypothetical protein